MVTVETKKSEAIVLEVQLAIEQLRKLETGESIVSAYVDTSPARIEGQAYLLAYRDGCRAIRRQLSEAEANAFKVATRRIERYLTEELTPGRPGLGLFRAASSEHLIVVPLPKPPLEHVTWSTRPEIAPLEAMLDEHERIAVVLFDTERARLFTVFLGRIESQRTLRDYVPGKQATGGWFALQQTSFERHREDHLRRHAAHTVRALLEVQRAHAFDRLLIGGPDEALAVLRHQLPRPLRTRLAGSVQVELFASDADVLTAALRAAELIERREEQHLVVELLGAASTPHVELGVVGTLDALAEGRIHLLVLSENFAQMGGQCAACGRLVTDARGCPACGAATRPVQSLREPLVQQALAQAARVELVSGPAAACLNEHGGIGAWTRF